VTALAEQIGLRLLSARRRAGLSRAKLAEALGSSSETIAQYERGQRMPTVERVLAIAAALKCEPGELLDGVSPTTERKS
jgi:transcriptional regulator with XRE-family HTH domain